MRRAGTASPLQNASAKLETWIGWAVEIIAALLLLAETGRKLSRARSGDKSGLSILGGGAIRTLVLDPLRAKPALILLQQEGTTELGWSGHRFWWPILAAPGTAEPCVFATKVMSD